MKAVLRNIQTFFPFLHDLRFALKLLFIRIRKRPHENDFYAMEQFKPGQNQVFMDVGANRGESIMSMLLFKQFDNPIMGFEPNPLIFRKLSFHFKNRKRVSLFNVGLGSGSGERLLFVPFYRRWMFDGLSSFKKKEAAAWLRDRMWRFRQRHLQIRELKCAMSRMDDFQCDPYFIKIDVQGYETEVIRGAEKTIRTSQPVLLVENLQVGARQLLQSWGYRFFSFENNIFREGMGALNTFCMTEERCRELLDKSGKPTDGGQA